MRTYLELPGLPEDGRLCHSPQTDTVEALIPNAPYQSCHAADLLETRSGDLLCVWFAGSSEGNADISIVGSRLRTGESQWSTPVRLTDDPLRSEQNPSLFQHPNGEIWLMYTAQAARRPDTPADQNLQYTAEIRRRISRDEGHTWEPWEVMFAQPGSFCRQKIQILSGGRWIFGNWRCFDDDTRNASDVTVFQISDDQGVSWRAVEVPGSTGRVHANVLELAPGRLMALMRSRFADRIWRTDSMDNGEHWTIPIRTGLPNNNSSISAIRLFSGALCVIYNGVSFSSEPAAPRAVWPRQRCPIHVALSEDGGQTWPFRRIIEHGEGFAGPLNDVCNRRYEYPVILQDRSGLLHAAWSWGDRRHIKYASFTEDWIRGQPHQQ